MNEPPDKLSFGDYCLIGYALSEKIAHLEAAPDEHDDMDEGEIEDMIAALKSIKTTVDGLIGPEFTTP